MILDPYLHESVEVNNRKTVSKEYENSEQFPDIFIYHPCSNAPLYQLELGPTAISIRSNLNYNEHERKNLFAPQEVANLYY